MLDHYSTPMEVPFEGTVLIEGPGATAGAFTADAAEESVLRLPEAATKARSGLTLLFLDGAAGRRYSREMTLFLTTLREPSVNHRVEAVTEGFLILPNPGREHQFDDLAREVVNYVGPFAAFARRAADGLYDCVHILPTDIAISEARTFDHPALK